MTAASPWSVKGIDPKAREMAKDLARRSGMTLGEWLNQVITEGESEAPPFEAQPNPRADIGYRGIPARDYSPPGEPFRAPSQNSAQNSGRTSAPKGEEMQRITHALDQLSARIEAAEQRSTLAISGIDQSVMGVLSRFESVEREQGAVAARFDGALDEVRDAQAKANDKMRRLSDEEVPRIEAMKALEGALGKMAEKLYEGETRTRATLNELREDGANLSRRMDRTEAKVEAEPATALVDSVVARIAARLEQAESKTSEAVRGLEASFAGLDARLKASEAKLEPQADAAERRFERLTAELADKVEATRTEMAERLRDAADGKLDRMEAALRELAGHVEQGERNASQAIDRMGREVMRVASTLGERVSKVEARGAEAVEQVGGEMARIAVAIEQRMGRQDAVQAEALEKLGAEIGRIAEKLAERIANADRRSTQSVDEVGAQLERVTEQLNQRQERANTELTDRIQQSEMRTVKLLEEAQGKLEERLTETQRRSALEAAVEAARKAAETQDAAKPVIGSDDFILPFGGGAGAPAAPHAAPEPFASAVLINDPFVAPAPAFEAPALSEASFTDAFVAPMSTGYGGLAEEAYIAPVALAGHAVEPESAPVSNREMLEQARAAARQASERTPSKSRWGEAVETPPYEGDASKPFSFGVKKKKKEAITLRTALVASGTAAAAAVTLLGGGLLVATEQVPHADHAADHASEQFGVAPTAAQSDATPVIAAAVATPAPDTSGTAPAAPSAPAGGSATPPAGAQMAVALTPPPGQIEGLKTSASLKTPTAKAAPAPKTPALPDAPPKSASAATIYSAAVRKIESNDLSGLEDLKKAANLGHPAAQFYLAKLYETAGAGLKKDLAEARRWTERAAAGGDVAAMHNLGLYYYEGEAGSQDSSKAAYWFRRAADQGVKDSQFNLALLYAKGYGVAQNPAEAYKWYLIAAANGDDGAKSAAQAIRAQLPADTQAAAERAAAAYHAQALASVRIAPAPVTR